MYYKIHHSDYHTVRLGCSMFVDCSLTFQGLPADHPYLAKKLHVWLANYKL